MSSAGLLMIIWLAQFTGSAAFWCLFRNAKFEAFGPCVSSGNKSFCMKSTKLKQPVPVLRQTNLQIKSKCGEGVSELLSLEFCALSSSQPSRAYYCI